MIETPKSHAYRNACFWTFVLGALFAIGSVWVWNAGSEARTLCIAFKKEDAIAELQCMNNKLREAEILEKKEAATIDDLATSIKETESSLKGGLRQ